MLVYIVLLGPPGAGKGTQANKLCKALSLPHISSGDIFRENIKNQTELGVLAKGYIDCGELVPDSATITMIRERLSQTDCSKGALLDGFPRNPAQAEVFDTILEDFGGKVDVVPYIHVPESILVERLSGRWNCQKQGHVFHEVYNPPKERGICDFDGSGLYQREDDKVETVTNRIRVYHKQTQPLIDYYHKKGILVEIDGTQTIEKVTADILAVVHESGS
jgi:adenylate kinase